MSNSRKHRILPYKKSIHPPTVADRNHLPKHVVDPESNLRKQFESVSSVLMPFLRRDVGCTLHRKLILWYYFAPCGKLCVPQFLYASCLICSLICLKDFNKHFPRCFDCLYIMYLFHSVFVRRQSLIAYFFSLTSFWLGLTLLKKKAILNPRALQKQDS